VTIDEVREKIARNLIGHALRDRDLRSLTLALLDEHEAVVRLRGHGGTEWQYLECGCCGGSSVPGDAMPHEPDCPIPAVNRILEEMK
jgi:hypothetical protein